ncbi:hypothetical protein PIB30_031845 [Stylosanthes scabra]|uniref:Uncharacterized protein n=1 Tax=Stylosanthes scabra TaxID=79078 RepID=A0ABU6TE49_9FABA|nr:hypothetical protein [Stylosanthes scabra]
MVYEDSPKMGVVSSIYRHRQASNAYALVYSHFHSDLCLLKPETLEQTYQGIEWNEKRPAATDSQQAAPSPQLNTDSLHVSQAPSRIPPLSKSFRLPSHGIVRRAISDVIELMLNELWINYSEISDDVQKRWFEKWARRLSGHPPTNPELFRETHTRNRDRSIVEKCADDLLLQTLSEPYKNRVCGAGGFFVSSLRRSGYRGSSASSTSTHIGPVTPEWQMAAFYNPIHRGSSAIVGGSGSSTAPPLPPRPPLGQPNHPPYDDDDDYKDA